MTGFLRASAPFALTRLVRASAPIALTALLALPAAAESLLPRDEAPAATVRILPADLTPERTQVDEGRSVRIANRTTALARIEFHVKRGTGLACARPGEAVVSARKFVLAEGESLHCTPPRGRVEYRVQRVVRLEGQGLRNRVTEGAIEVR